MQLARRGTLSLRRKVLCNRAGVPVITHTSSDSSQSLPIAKASTKAWLLVKATCVARQRLQGSLHKHVEIVSTRLSHGAFVMHQVLVSKSGWVTSASPQHPPHTLATAPHNRNAHVESTCGFHPQAQIGQSQNCCHATALPSSHLASAFRKADQGSGFVA